MERKEGLIPVVRAEKDGTVYCPICRKVLEVKAGLGLLERYFK